MNGVLVYYSIATSAVSSSTPTAGYLETDLDTKVTRDISISQGMNTGMGSYGPETYSRRDDKYDSVHSSRSSYLPPSSSTSGLPNDRARIEYKYVAPPAMNQIRHPTSNQHGSRANDRDHWANPHGFQPMAYDGIISKSNNAGDRRNQHNNQLGPNGSTRLVMSRSTSRLSVETCHSFLAQLISITRLYIFQTVYN